MKVSIHFSADHSLKPFLIICSDDTIHESFKATLEESALKRSIF